jgi:hypothetical protein
MGTLMAREHRLAVAGGRADKGGGPTAAISAERQTRRAWRVLFLSALCFAVIASALGVGFTTYRTNATRPRGGVIRSFLTGTQAQIRGRQQVFWHDVAAGATINEGDTVRTGEDTRLRITLFDDTLVELIPGTEVTFDSLRASQYLDSNATIDLHQDSGRLVITLSKETPFARTRTTVTTRGAVIEARQPGTSFRVLVVPGLPGEVDRADVSVLDGGDVSVTGAGRMVTIANGQQTIVYAGSAPSAAAIKQTELIDNGDFKNAARGQAPAHWEVKRDDGGDGNLNRASWELVPETVRGQPVTALHFVRTGGNTDGDLVGVQQSIAFGELDEYDSVVLSADVKVVSQNLSGGGSFGTEYPMTFLIRYVTQRNDPVEKGLGFFNQNDAANPTVTATLTGVQVKPGEWTPVQLNLKDLKQIYPAPYKLVNIWVYASGHDYDASVANLSIVAK